MNKLNKTQLKTMHDLQNDLHSRADDVETAVRVFNQKQETIYGKYKDGGADYMLEVTEAFSFLDEKIDDFNNVIDDAKTFIEEVASLLEEEYNNKSEKWQESDTGEVFSGWMSEWQDICLDEYVLENPAHEEVSEGNPPEEIIFDSNSVNDFDCLPEEAGC